MELTPFATVTSGSATNFQYNRKQEMSELIPIVFGHPDARAIDHTANSHLRYRMCGQSAVTGWNCFFQTTKIKPELPRCSRLSGHSTAANQEKAQNCIVRHTSSMVGLQTSDGQTDKVLAFKCEGRGFKSSYRWSAHPNGSPLLAAATFLKIGAYCCFINKKK